MEVKILKFVKNVHKIRRRRRDGSEHILAPEALQDKTLRLCARHTEDYKVGNEDRLVQKFDLKKGFGGVNYQYQIHQKAVNMPHQPTKLTKTTSIMAPLLIERLRVPTMSSITPDRCISHNAIMGKRIIGSKRSIMARSFAILQLGTLIRFLGPI